MASKGAPGCVPGGLWVGSAAVAICQASQQLQAWASSPCKTYGLVTEVEVVLQLNAGQALMR